MEKIKKFLFTNINTRQIIVKNTFWLTVSTTASKVIRTLMIIYVARMLGAGQYGIFSYALGLASIFSLFSDIGLTSLLIKELVRNKFEDNKNYISAIIGIKGILLILSFILIITLAPLTSNIQEATSLLPLIAFLLLFDNIRSFGFSIIRSEDKMEREAKIDIATEFLTAIITISLLVISPSVKNLILGYLLGSGFGALAALSVMRKYLKNIWQNIKKKIVIEAIQSALPYAVVGIFATLMTNFDMFILGYFLDASSVGLYAAALRPIGLLYLIPGFLSSAIFPTMNQLETDKEDGKLKNLIEQSITATLALAIPITVGGIIIGGSLIHNMFGTEYAGSIGSFKILLISIIPIFPGMIISYFLLAKGIKRAPLKATGIGALLNIVLDLILIPKYGIIGSAVATVSAQFVMNTILLYEIRTFFKLSIITKLGKIIIATGLMGTLSYILLHAGLNSILIIVSAGILYILILILLKEELLKKIITTLRM